VSVSFDGAVVVAEAGMSLFECAEAAGIAVPTSCFKQGKCRECLVEVEEGAEFLTAPAPQEDHLQGRFRLSCRARITRAGAIRCHTLRRGALRIETEARALDLGVPLEPAVRRDGSVILLDGQPVAESEGGVHGLAIDVGTTTVALRLYDLETGALLATQSFENPQRFGGSDVMARIRYDGEHAGRLLQRTLIGYLNHAVERLPCDGSSIYEVVVAANTTIRDLFLGLDVQPIGHLPYRSLTEEALRAGRAETTAVSVAARRLRLNTHPDARVYGLPLVGSHVGADAAACLLATGLAERGEIAAVLDIGTNTEVLLGNRERIVAASCPAGPAFEGGGVSCGMPALDGAVERVRIAEGGTLEITTIGGAPPLGACGSGLVDALSELLRTGRMNEQGRLAGDASRFALTADARIALSEADINELAQAKGANVAGLRIAAFAYGIEVHQIQRLFLAGAFARHLDVEAACRIGLIPDLPRERIAQVGNASLHGASLALLSVPRRRGLEETVKRIQHVRLEQHPRFFDVFVDGCQFAPFGREER
jgi:uncharacterized 2Fe-2S/4Fe-4S cluster protein (DUF4445 family)